MFRAITTAEITAARLRRMAAALILEADALDATAGRETDGRNRQAVFEECRRKIRGEIK